MILLFREVYIIEFELEATISGYGRTGNKLKGK